MINRICIIHQWGIAAILYVGHAPRVRPSVPFEAMSGALNQKSCGISALYCVRFSSNAARAGTPGFFNSMTTSGRPLTKPTKSGRQV